MIDTWIIDLIKQKIEAYESQKTYTDCEEYRREGAVGVLETLLEDLTVTNLEENKQVKTPHIQEAVCYITKSGKDIERQEHADLWHIRIGVITGIAWVDREKNLHFNPYDHSLSSWVDPIVKYSFDYGETWIEVEGNDNVIKI